MLDDLDQMRAMLESVLSFLRNGRRLEAMTLADVASTLQLITDQFADMGRKVAYDGPAHAMATVRPDGTPQVNPTWFRFDGEYLWLTTTSRRQKNRNWQHQPAVALSICDPGERQDGQEDFVKH